MKIIKRFFTTLVLLIFISSITFASVGKDTTPKGTISSIVGSVTIITHGWQAGGNSTSEVPLWVKMMASSIIARSGKGSIYQHNTNTGQWETTSFFSNNSNHPNDNIILLYNWVWDSDDPNYGWLTGAADNLLASLHLTPSSLSNSSDINFITDKKIHFIGHSRGAVLNFETLKLIKYYYPAKTIDQVTSLDPHPATYTLDPGFLSAFLTRKIDPLVGNVAFADNYYRTDFGYEVDGDFDGVNIKGAYNFKLEEDLLDPNGYPGEHSDVHLWYHGTIDTNSNAYDGEENVPTTWYLENTRYNLGFYFAMQGISNRPDPNENIENITVSLNYSIFNGNFNYSNLVGSQIPGWERHGGGGNGHLGRYDNIAFNPHMELDWNNSELAHNYFYIPSNAEKIYFRYRITNASFNDKFKVYIGSQNIINEDVGSWRSFYHWREIAIPQELKGTSQTLKFMVDGSGTVTSEVWIDDIGFTKKSNLIASILSNIGTKPNPRPSVKTETHNVELHVYDYLGNHTGQTDDTTWVTEIPGSQYLVYTDSLGATRQSIILPEPPNGNEYRFEVIAKENQENLSFQLEDSYSATTSNTVTFENINLQQDGSVTVSTSDVSSDLSIDIDSDGDGTVDTQQPPTTTVTNYLVSATTDGNGIISPQDTLYVANGEDATFTITPNTNYKIADVLFDGNSVGVVTEYTITSIDSDHSIHATFSPTTDVDDNDNLPTEYKLEQNHPNPFNPTTTISYALPKQGHVLIKIFDINGKEIKTLINKTQTAGYYSVTFDASNLSSSVYFYSFRSGSFTSTKKMLLIK